MKVIALGSRVSRVVAITAFMVADQKTDVTRQGTLSMLATIITEDAERDRALEWWHTDFQGFVTSHGLKLT